MKLFIVAKNQEVIPDYKKEITRYGFNYSAKNPDMIISLGGDGTFLVAENKTLPYSFLLNTYPNPFNARLIIEFRLNQNGFQKIQIFDLNGRLVKDLSGIYNSGNSRLSWDAKNVSSGLYIVSFNTQYSIIIINN